MKHSWFDPRPNGPLRLMTSEKRRCLNCGAEQELYVHQEWMRVVSRRWVPLAGRCVMRTSLQQVLFRAMTYGGWTKTAVRREFGVSKPTLEMWISGANEPHTALKIVVIEKLARSFKK